MIVYSYVSFEQEELFLARRTATFADLFVDP
jgi:hypothetical protein